MALLSTVEVSNGDDRNHSYCHNQHEKETAEADCLAATAGAAKAILISLKRTGRLPDIRLNKAIIQFLRELNFIKLACESQSGRICLSNTIPHASVQAELMQILARHASQRDLREVILPVDLSEDAANLAFLEHFTESFKDQSLEKLSLQIKTTQDHPGHDDAMSRPRGLPWLSRILRLLTRIPRKELYISIESNGSIFAERECKDFFKLLRHPCSGQIFPDCTVRVSIRGSTILGFPVSFYESLATCNYAITEVRVQETSECPLYSLETLLKSTLQSNTRMREIAVFRVRIPTWDAKRFCSILAETLWNPMGSLECLDLYQTSLRKVVLDGQLHQALTSAADKFSSPFHCRRLKRLRFDASDCSDTFWSHFCSDVLPYLNVTCLSVYNVKWNANVCASFLSGIRNNQCLEELELVYLAGCRRQYFLVDQKRIKPYLTRNAELGKVWDDVSMCYFPKTDFLPRILEKMAGRARKSRELSDTNFLYRVVRYGLAAFLRPSNNAHSPLFESGSQSNDEQSSTSAESGNLP